MSALISGEWFQGSSLRALTKSYLLNPQPSTLNPQPSTLNPPPSSLNPQHSTLNPPPSTLNPQPSTLSCATCGRRWNSNQSEKCSYERPTLGTVCGTMRSMCGADAGCLAIDCQSLCATCDDSHYHHQRQLPGVHSHGGRHHFGDWLLAPVGNTIVTGCM